MAGIKTAMAVLFLALGMSGTAAAQVQHCKITSVHDGDSMRVRCPGQKKTIAVRLDRIDAPEVTQAHGIASRDYLRTLCPVGQAVAIDVAGLDRYRRTLAQVSCNGVNANAAMVKSGNAWVYEHYTDDASLRRDQAKAKAERLGLWENRKAMPPWDFRKAQKSR